MKAAQLKGALFEYLVRRLLINCGFYSVQPDNLYTFERNPLFFINGRGAAHDADVLMEPPIQMPFGYPARLLFECKAYDSKAGLPIIRNALGLKYDINEFEIVTKKSLLSRQNNNRASYAIENRQRHVYQVGVASAEGFSKNAIGFAANNKIPLLSLSWMLDRQAMFLYRSIDQPLVDSMDQTMTSNLYDYFKDRNPGAEAKHIEAVGLLEEYRQIGYIIESLNRNIDSTYIGLLESGDLIFLFERETKSASSLYSFGSNSRLSAQLHYSRDNPEIWYLAINSNSSGARNLENENNPEFMFHVPPRIMGMWREFALDRSKAIQIKEEFFSTIFIFKKTRTSDIPFFVVNLDKHWLDEVRMAETDFSSAAENEDESDD
jgi:hypothetical protein